MGYTRYWEHPNQTEEKFKRFSNIAEQLKDQFVSDTNVEIADWAGDEVGSEVYDESKIRFNGFDEDAHESFSINKDGTDFAFCKTARKPYDALANMTLQLATRMLDGFTYSSDGENGDEENIEYLNKFLRDKKIGELIDGE